MGLFDIFKKKALVEQPKTYICARCKKEITDSESKWIGNHRFCVKCAASPKNATITPKHKVDNFATTKQIKASPNSLDLQEEAKKAGYQAYMDYAKGSLTPEEAYLNRGFVKDKNGNWVYRKLQTKDTFICSKCGKELKKKYLHQNNTCVDCATAPDTSFKIVLKQGGHKLPDGCILEKFYLYKENDDIIRIFWSVGFGYSMLGHNPGAGGNDIVPAEYFINHDLSGFATYISNKYKDIATYDEIYYNSEIQTLFELLALDSER